MTEAGLPSGAATRCHETARRELELGQRLCEAGDGCDGVRAELCRRLTREHRRARFGVVDHRRVDLVRVRLRLSTAAGCRRWPLRRAASSSLTPVEASRHGCRLRPYRGAIDLTVFVTHRTRPLDERAIAWFENMYKQNGFAVDEISFQHDYQKKSGIYTKLHIIDPNTGTPTREIVQFMFPREDVVFIARMEYPFGETRSVEQDWKYILWNFDLVAGTGE